MARFLIVVPPLVGHVNPLVGVAAELSARGHDVVWAGSPRIVHAAAGPDADVRPAGPDPDGPVTGRPPGLRAFAALRHLWEKVIVPLAGQMLPAVDDAVTDVAPDLIVADQQALAGPLAARRHGLPWVTSASTSAELGDPFAGLPKIADWIAGLQGQLHRSVGLGDPPAGSDLRFSPHLVLAFSAESLAGPTAALAGPVRFVGPSLANRAEQAEFPWHLRDARPLAVVTLGTANAETAGRFLGAAHDALTELAGDVQAVIADPAHTLADRPATAAGPIVVERIPQVSMLRDARLAVCHGGHNTVVEALGFGVPLVVAPIRDDQPVIAQQVVDAGAGLRLRFDRATASDVATACRTLLEEPQYTKEAARIAEDLTAAGGAPAAADALLAQLDLR